MIRVLLFATLFLSAACATAPEPVIPDEPAVEAPPAPAPAPRPVVRGPVLRPEPATPSRSAFNALPGWRTADVAAGVTAFSRSCGEIVKKPHGQPLSSRAKWAGETQEWVEACRAMRTITDEASARAMIEQLFTPVEIIDPEDGSKFTGYFEPMIEARRTPQFPFDSPIPGPPDDLVQDNGPKQRLPDGSLRPYPPRGELTPQNVLGYAHPADVFFLQIQGSGRVTFPDGAQIRAAYFAHNGQPFASTANWLMNNGKITRGEASMQGIRAWMDRVSRAEAAEAMNANPRYVFFRELPVGDPSLGPVGAETTPLTPLGSMAVDRDYHALGVPFWVQTNAPGLGGEWSGLLVAQDTGGAINGPVRGDIFYGTGFEAGERAGVQNAPGRKWALIPKAAAERLRRALEPGV